MQNFKESFIKSVAMRLTSDYDSEQIRKITNTILICAEDFDIVPKSTELMVVDTESEHLLKMFAGTLLTEGKSKNTVKIYNSILTRFKNDIDVPLKDVTTPVIRLWLAKMQQQVSLTTCENYRAYLSSFYNFLSNEEIIQKNPMAKVKPIKHEQSIKKAFSDVDIDSLRSHCKTLRDRAVLEFMLTSGARVSEVAAMNIDDINPMTLEVVIREGKGNKQRITYINEVCYRHIQNYLGTRNDDSNALFLNRYGERANKAAFNKMLKALEKTSGVANVHPHRFRRTFATNLHKRNVDIRTIQLLMGHSNIQTTTTYISSDVEKIKSEYKRVS